MKDLKKVLKRILQDPQGLTEDRSYKDPVKDLKKVLKRILQDPQGLTDLSDPCEDPHQDPQEDL